ncbi:MAG: glycosyltransferase family 39 protein [Candidatus Roizmanbacteria bacterium]|nr:glycosyltransferase family 39 protein [Candidatus Roizmanbacteria bacterium]
MWKRIQPYCSITFVVLLSTFILWAPFLFKWNSAGYVYVPKGLSMLDLYKHWDGPLYIVVAKTFYNTSSTILKGSFLGLSPGYFAAHLPLYPLFIRSTAWLVGYLPSMLLWPVIGAVAYTNFFYFFVRKYTLSSRPLILTIVAAFITPRFFVVRSIGAPETLFLFFMLVSVHFFIQKKYLYAGVAGGLTILTKSPAILLFGAYGLWIIAEYIRTKKIHSTWISLLLIPLSLVGLFGWFAYSSGDFFAYFHSGDNIHLFFPPFQVFDVNARWVGTGWLEDILFIYMFYLSTLFSLYSIKKLRAVFYFALLFYIAIISVQHRDIARYSLPLLPFGLIAHEQFFTSKKFMIAMVILLPALYMYAWNFILFNQAPITDWAVLR